MYLTWSKSLYLPNVLMMVKIIMTVMVPAMHYGEGEARMGVFRDSEGLNLSNVFMLKVKMMMTMFEMYLGEGEARCGIQ